MPESSPLLKKLGTGNNCYILLRLQPDPGSSPTKTEQLKPVHRVSVLRLISNRLLLVWPQQSSISVI